MIEIDREDALALNAVYERAVICVLHRPVESAATSGLSPMTDFERATIMTTAPVGDWVEQLTVEQIDVIDGLGLDKKTGASVLTIADHLSWHEDLQHHQDCLERKLGTYVQFVESGQLREHHPDAKNPTIQLFLLHRPTERGLRALKGAQEALEARGITLSYGPIPDGYDSDN